MKTATTRFCYTMLFLLTLLLIGCTVSLDPEVLLEPPRIATQTAQAVALTSAVAEATPVPTAPPIPTWTPVSAELLRPEISTNERLTVWINETSADHVSALRAIGQQFEAAHNAQVEFVFVDTENVVGLARSAQLTERLPDVIFHNLEQTAGLLSQNILDVAAADDVIEVLSAENFVDGALDAQPRVNDLIPAIPIDGWQYLIVYRQDWFDEAGLPPPDTYDALFTAAATFDTISFDPTPTPEPDATPTPAPPLRSGLVVPTEQDLPSTQRVFEWIATANGCQITDGAGDIIFEQPACLDALEFYRSLITQHGPPDFQTDITALKAFADGRTAMAIVPPSGLAYYADVAGPELTQNVGIVTTLTGYSDYRTTTSFANLTYLGIVQGADPLAATFAEFWFTDAYGDWLAVEPARKVPLWQNGDADWFATWQTLPISVESGPLDALYPAQNGAAFSAELATDLVRFERWGFGTGREPLASRLYEDLTIAPVLTRMLNGYIGSYQAILDANEEIFEAAAATQPVIDS